MLSSRGRGRVVRLFRMPIRVASGLIILAAFRSAIGAVFASDARTESRFWGILRVEGWGLVERVSRRLG